MQCQKNNWSKMLYLKRGQTKYEGSGDVVAV